MAVKIRLSRIGKKHVPFFRIIAVDSRKKRDGAYLAIIGTYDALKHSVVTFNEDTYQDWVKKGAQPSDTAKKVYRLYKKSTGKGPIETAIPTPKKSKKTTTVAQPSPESAE
jgi:small subunit ribosomal protein S16